MTYTVLAEAFTSAHDVAVQLDHTNLIEGFAVVSDGENPPFEEGTDYTISYSAGTITVLSTGSMADATEYYINYVWTFEGYCNSDEVQYWALDADELGADYETATEYFIGVADRAIDAELTVPEGFFMAGGAEFEEQHDGVELGWVSSWVENPFSQVKAKPLLRLKYGPILSVSSVEVDGSGLTVDTDYVVDALGIRFLKNVPKYDYGNVTVTYTAGYVATPSQVSNVSAQLAASIIQRVIDSKGRASVSLGGLNASRPTDFMTVAKACFTESLKAELARFRNVIPPKVV